MSGNNRQFVLIAVFLVGMLVLGLVAIFVVVLFGLSKTPTTARVTATPTLAALVRAPTFTPTPLPPTATPVPTNTAPPTPTNTPVIPPSATPTSAPLTPEVGPQAEPAGQMPSGAGVNVTPAAQPTPTRTPPAGAVKAGEQSTTPNTGIGGIEALFIAAGLVVVLIVTRRLRLQKG